MKRILSILVLASTLLPTAHAQTIFYFTSSPTSFVGGGQTFYATPEAGYTINVSDSWRVSAWCYGPGFNPSWQVLLQAANNQPVTVGEYDNTQETADSTHPSLYFFGQGRASSGPTGHFNVMDLTLDTNGNVLSFAADWVQYDHGDPAAWNAGSIRFNSSIPIPAPEPRLLAPLALICCFQFLRRRLHVLHR
jgi:hypothetical protein